MKEKKDSVTIIDELWQIVEELEARDISANSIHENLHGVSWTELCNKGVKLFKQLKKVD